MVIFTKPVRELVRAMREQGCPFKRPSRCKVAKRLYEEQKRRKNLEQVLQKLTWEVITTLEDLRNQLDDLATCKKRYQANRARVMCLKELELMLLQKFREFLPKSHRRGWRPPSGLDGIGL